MYSAGLYLTAASVSVGLHAPHCFTSYAIGSSVSDGRMIVGWSTVV
jgi:hypothetical protein